MIGGSLGRVPVGDTGAVVTELGFGAAAIGGLFETVPGDVARGAIERAWDAGVRYFDVAPLYGYGQSERRLGEVLQHRPREEFTVSTKVGRLLVPLEELERRTGLERDRQEVGGVADALFHDLPPVRPVFDFSADGVRRSLEESLGRLGLDSIDIVYLHDPDGHWDSAFHEALPTLRDLRDEGVVKAIGAGMNQALMLTRFVREGDIDVVLCAGRYTLMDQRAMVELFPACLERGVSVVLGGVLNSGLLVHPGAGATFDYAPASAAIVDAAVVLRDACEAQGVPLRAAALQFSLAHPVVASILTGARSSDEVDDTLAMLRYPIPTTLWRDLAERGLIPPDAPLPGARPPG